MRRHIKTIHYDTQSDDKSVEQEGMGSGIDEDDIDESSKSGSAETEGSNVYEEDNEEEEEEYEEDDHWLSIIETVFEQCQRKFDKRVANHMSSADMDEATGARRLDSFFFFFFFFFFFLHFNPFGDPYDMFMQLFYL